MEYYFHAGVVQLAATWILQNPVNMHPMYKPPQGFPQVLRTWVGGGGGAEVNTWGEHGGGLKMLSKNTCEGVYLIVKLLAISLQACKFTKMNFTHIFQGF